MSAGRGSVGRFGSWQSPITAALVASQGVRLAEPTMCGESVYWLEGRPADGGRVVPVGWQAGATVDLIPPGFNARSRVHEYGGGAYALDGESVYFSNFADGRIYRSRHATSPPTPLSPDGAWHYADLQLDAARRRLIAVREDHTRPGQEAVTSIVAIPVDGASPAPEIPVLAEGYDFYSTPRLNRDGTRLAWVSWRHPHMPWDGTELWVASVARDGSLTDARVVAGGHEESIYQPGWLHDGTLVFASDRSGWWQLYRMMIGAAESRADPLVAHPPARSEFGRPEWVFGTRTWAQASPTRLVVSYTTAGRWHLAAVDLDAGSLRPLAEGLEPHEWLAATPTHVCLVASSTTTPAAVVRVGLDDGHVEILRSSSDTRVDPGYLSEPCAIEFATARGRTAHAFCYAPVNADWSAPPGERPPLIVISHGGPTTATTVGLDLRIQYWTSRGFAVVDVNYGGSSGYGRDYRRRLDGQWGIVDVEDVIAAARHLVSTGDADPRRLIVRGGSAGGYTTLAALTFHPGAFQAGASYYGICDLEVLARDTHKFEARYLDRLVGPYPETRDEYRRRSPIHAVDRLASALILLQGSEDRVVPPNQSRMMAQAVRDKGLPVAYVEFEGEQHGFRRADTIVAALEAELFFYGRVFGFAPPGIGEPIEIENL